MVMRTIGGVDVEWDGFGNCVKIATLMGRWN